MPGIPETTADAVVDVVEAVVAGRGTSTVQAVADFTDMPLANAEAAIDLAVDLGLVVRVGQTVQTNGPLGRLLSTPSLSQKAAILRVAVESFEPFRVFRERLHQTGQVSAAAQQTKALLSLTEHRETIKQTLLSLGTYSQSLNSIGGGQYEVRFNFDDELTSKLAGAVSQLSEAELRVRDWLSETVRSTLDAPSVLDPLAEAYLKVSEGDARGAVVTAGNAVESHLAHLGAAMGVNVAGAHGLGAKVAAFDNASQLPKKLVAVGRYLGSVRNAADHGVDSEIGAAWLIREGTGEDFLRVAITFIEATSDVRDGRPYAI